MAKAKKAAKKPLGRKAMKKTKGGKVSVQDFSVIPAKSGRAGYSVDS